MNNSVVLSGNYIRDMLRPQDFTAARKSLNNPITRDLETFLLYSSMR